MSAGGNSEKRNREGLKFSDELKAFVADLGDVQLMSLGAVDILRDLSRPDISGRAISNKIGQDPTLSARILRLANSSYYGVANRVSTVNQAVTLLGIENVRKLVQGLCLVEMSTPHGALSTVFGGQSFAAHAMAVSFLAGAITQKFTFQMLGRGEAETAGLLHDIGMCLIGSGDRKRYEGLQLEIWSQVEEYLTTPEGMTLPYIENETLGFTHAELGAWLATEWRLPLSIRESLAYHHGPIDQCINKEAVTAVHLAEILANEEGLDYLPPGGNGSVHPTVREFLKTQGKEELLDRLGELMKEDVERARKMYRMLFVEEEIDEEAEAPRSAASETSRERPRSATLSKIPSPPPPPKAPPWALLVPGLPQILKGNSVIGAILLVGFCLSFLLFVVALTSAGGAPQLAFAFIALAAASWVLSVLLA